jgi:phage-related protein
MSPKPLVCVGSALEDLRALPEAVRVLHVFEKKTRKITERDLDLARARLSLLRAQRGAGSP